jgi:plasmid replication initiation protein
MKANSKEVVQGYVLTSAKYNFSRYEKWILYALVEIAQADTSGKKLNTNYKINRNLFNDVLIEIPYKRFFPDGEKNHAQLKKALTSLRNKTIEYEDDNEWRLIGIIEKPKVEKNEHYIAFEVQPLIWEAILNFSKGHSKVELNAAMKFTSVFAMRFFELFYKNLKPQTLSIDDLKKRFGLENKYDGRPSDFIKRVIKPAKKELDEKSEYSFNYKTIKVGRKIDKIVFVPYFIESNRNDEQYKKDLEKQLSLRNYLSVNFIKQLNNLGFSEQGVKNNLELLKEANQKIDLANFISNISRKSQEAKNPPAYIIGALKKHLSNNENSKPKNLEMVRNIDNLLDDLSNEKTNATRNLFDDERQKE